MTEAATHTELAEYGLFIGGSEVASQSGKTFESVNPATSEPWARVAEAGAADVDRAVRAAHAAFSDPSWRDLSPTRRGRLMMRLGDLIAERADEIAAIETRDNGKLYKEMRAQLRAIPDWFYYFGGLADKIEGRTIPLDSPTTFNYTLREPVGVVGLITPWNSPALIATMSMVPALAAGNTIVLKPSEITPASAVELARLASDAGFPPGVINVVTGQGAAGAAIVDHELVAKISFTGGTATGKQILQRAGRRLARTTLELGGKSPNIVFGDANLDAAEAGVLAGIFAAAGQTCIAGSRAFIHSSIYDELLGRLAARAESITLGDPMRDDVQIGPVATGGQLEKIEAAVVRATQQGAKVVAGGARASVPGLPGGQFYLPTILAGVTNDAEVAQEEIFGPVLTVMPFDDEDEVVELANDSRYGLAAGVWTHDVKRAHRMAKRLEAGTVWINMYRAATFNSPFGGYKESGLGRRNGIEAVDEFLETKSVWLELGDAIQDPFVMKV